MRKFGCNILAVVQQYDVLRASEARGAIIGGETAISLRVELARQESYRASRLISLMIVVTSSLELRGLAI